MIGSAMRANQMKAVLVSFGLCVTPAAWGQYGDVDPSFNVLDNGQFGDGALKYHSRGSTPSGSTSTIAERPDGRIIAAGDLWTFNGAQCPGVAQLLPDGQRDPDFGMSLPPGYGPVWRSVLLPDGGFLLVCGAPSGTFALPYALLRYSADDELDPDFQVIANSIISSVVPLPDGRIAIAGYFTSVSGGLASRVAILQPDGSIDAGFDMSNGPNNRVSVVLPLSDGSFLIGGDFTAVNGVARKGLARLFGDGALDAAFDPMISTTGAYTKVNALARDENGRVIVGGAFSFSSQTVADHLVRVLPDGNLDPSFGNGDGPSGEVSVVTQRTNGFWMIGGGFSEYAGVPCTGLVALLPDGALDTGFDARLGHAAGSIVYCITQAGNGELLIGGRFTEVEGRFRIGLTRLDANGAALVDFNPGRGSGGLIKGMARMANGRIAIAGDFISFNDVPRPYLAFLTEDGDLHPAFNGGTGPNAPVDQLVALPDGRLFLAGRFNQYNGVPMPGLAVVDAFGALDASVVFAEPPLPTTIQFTAALALTDGSIVVASTHDLAPGETMTTLSRYLPDGSQDAAFTPAMPIYGEIYSMAQQADGRLVLGGTHRLGSASAPLGIIRLLPNGNVDHTFNVGSGVGPAGSAGVMAIAALPDGRLILGGFFGNYRGTPTNGIVCVNSDGSPCDGFSTVGIESGAVELPAILSIVPLPDGRLVLSGWFNTFAGAPHHSVAVAMPDGTQDPSFTVGSGPAYPSIPWVTQVLVTSEGNYIISGLFHRFNGQAKHRIARLLGGGGVGVPEPSGPSDAMRLWPNPVEHRLFVDPGFTGVIIDALGKPVFSVVRATEIDIQALAPGCYIAHDQTGVALRFIKR
jgi:uncharacterized delta-60 repeat protein